MFKFTQGDNAWFYTSADGQVILPAAGTFEPAIITRGELYLSHEDTGETIDSTVPTAPFRVLYVFLVLSHERRRVVHFNVTEFPSASWTARQLVEAFPWDSAPKFLLRDRDSIYGHEVTRTIHSLCAEQVLTAPRSPWQNPYVERVVGSIRCECLDHVIVMNENHLRKVLKEYFRYYTESRTHLALGKDCPEPRMIEPPEMGKIVGIPRVAGLR